MRAAKSLYHFMLRVWWRIKAALASARPRVRRPRFSMTLVLWTIAYWACFVFVALVGGRGRAPRHPAPEK
jgi:hypothetical protein